MKITVNHDACSGHARCHAVAPGLYDLDGEGYSALGELEVPVGLRSRPPATARPAAPERAITITG